MTERDESEGGRQPGEDFSGTDAFGPTDDEDGTGTGRTTGTYTDAGDESVPPGQGDAEASGYS